MEMDTIKNPYLFDELWREHTSIFKGSLLEFYMRIYVRKEISLNGFIAFYFHLDLLVQWEAFVIQFPLKSILDSHVPVKR